MRIAFCLPLIALGLSACGSDAEEPKTEDEVIAAMEDLAKPEPGLYRTTTEMVEFSVPGLPEEQAQQLRKMRGDGVKTSEQCLTEEEANRGFKDMLREMSKPDEGLSCDFTRFDTSGSDLDAKMTCGGPGGTGAEIVLAGEVETTRSDLTMKMKVDAGPLGEMDMTMKTKSERIGDCK